MVICNKVRYTGRVQGVGFRYTAQRLAAAGNVVGYVKNLPTGDVELVAEGEADAVNAFLQRIAQHLGRYIDDVEVDTQAPQGFREFAIRY
jgi:acylphosphatase